MNEMGVKNMGVINSMFPHAMGLGLNAVMSSAIIGTWTAFEVLSGDLWEAALNHHPKTLSALSGNPKEWQNENSPDDEQKGQQKAEQKTDRTIPIWWLHEHFGTLSTTLGTILRRRFSFQTLPVIRKAYAHAFSADFDGVRTALMGTSIDHLAGVRNALVHRAGKADQKFKDQTRDCVHFDAVKPNDQIKLDGEIVIQLIGGAIGQTIALIMAVDDWIIAHGEKATNA
jgi:hypothetical protein